MIKRTFDRLVEFDEQSRGFPIGPIVGDRKPRSYTWSCNAWLDQGSDGSCVGFAWAHELAARPAVPVREVTYDTAFGLYTRARQLDQWDGEDYQGTSVIAGAKAATEAGHLREYRWAFGVRDLMLAVGYKGPAVLGISWYDGMFHPDPETGRIRPTGRVAGGHAILCRAVNVRTETFTLRNSWGAQWGRGGDAFVSFEDMERLLSEQGEACIPVVR